MSHAGERIRRLRVAKGLTQQELADKLEIDRSTVGHWETGRSEPDLATIVKLCEVLACRLEDIIPAPQPNTNHPDDAIEIRELAAESREGVEEHVDDIRRLAQRILKRVEDLEKRLPPDKEK